jgi:Protein of unknown function (DUF2970)
VADENPLERKPSFVATLKTVASSFFGVRNSKSHASDMTKVNPLHIIIAGVLMAGVFVFVLISVVRWVVK